MEWWHDAEAVGLGVDGGTPDEGQGRVPGSLAAALAVDVDGASGIGGDDVVEGRGLIETCVWEAIYHPHSWSATGFMAAAGGI